MSSLLNSYATKAVGTSLTQVYIAPTLKTAVVIGANIANITVGTIFFDIVLRKGGIDYYILKNCFIPSGAAYIWSGADQKICVDDGDSFLIKSDTAASLDVIVSAAEIA